jgi:phage terminase large subunit-like protein
MSQADEIRQKAEDDLVSFAKLVGINRVYGMIHEEVFRWMTRPGHSTDQLVLLPRGHLKSHMIAVWCAWWITKHPWTTILYVSATEGLAQEQLAAIKDILDSPTYRRFWPKMIHQEAGKRTQWSTLKVKVDHPDRKNLGVRDPTIEAAGITGNTTGKHCDVLILDDLVVPGNAYTEGGRETVQAGYSQLSSVLNAGGITKAVGTRYHGRDLYAMMRDSTYELYSDDGEMVGEANTFEVFERVVELDGQFLWPREQCPRTKNWYGFDHRELSKIRSKYFAAGERAQYYAQYYNNPSDPSSDRVNTEFRYYEPKHLSFVNGKWNIFGKELSVFFGGDLAYTTKASSDFTAYAVIGVDCDGFYYILQLDQFKTDKYSVYYEKFKALFTKWGFRRARIETNAGANLVVKFMEDELRRDGLAVMLDGKNAVGDKNERSETQLEPKYDNSSVYHYKGGYMNLYEEQITLARPSHDDLRDSVSIAFEISTIPRKRNKVSNKVSDITAHSRFGGIAR